MKIVVTESTIVISEIKELSASDAVQFRNEVRAQIPQRPEFVDLDMRDTRFVDSSGLGALFSIYKLVHEANAAAVIRILNPKPSIRQLFELTNLHQLVEIVRTSDLEKIPSPA